MINNGAIEILSWPDPWVRLPALAERLGVPEATAPAPGNGAVTIRTADGRSYDLFDLINAALDRLDAAATHSN